MEKAKKIILAVMCLLFAAPTIFSVIGKGNILSIDENRNKLLFDNISFEGNGDEVYSQISTWYNDNFGLRDLLIRLQHTVDYKLFRYNSTLYFSDGGYLYYKNVIDNEQILNEMAVNNEWAEKNINKLREIKNYLGERGIEFRIIIPPQKNEVLEEKIIGLATQRPEPTAYERMEKVFAESDLQNNYVSVINALKEANKKTPVYYRTDFHWNDWGAAVGFGEVINSYSQDIGLDSVYDIDKLEKSEFLFSGGQSSNLSILGGGSLMEPTVNISDGIKAVNVDLQSMDGFWNNYETSVLGGCLFIGDSYTPPALLSFNETSSGIVDVFSETYFCHWDNAEGVLKRIPQDVDLVVVELIESNIYRMDSILDKLLSE